MFLLGPFFCFKHDRKKGVGLGLLIIALTVFTQVGGVILWMMLPFLSAIKFRHRIARLSLQTGVFLVVYFLVVFLFVPFLAQIGDRVPLPCFPSQETSLQPANFGYCLLARNYVKPVVRDVLNRVSQKISTQYGGTTMMYLDANFPFMDGFPLLPHLSHKDGKKVDLAYFYRNAETKESIKTTPSPIGYWAYEQPKDGEIQPCKDVRSWLRWDFNWLQFAFVFAEIEPERTQALLNELIAAPDIQKILIEPHLKQRLDFSSSKVRFQGCRAARHDDHIHVQIY